MVTALQVSLPPEAMETWGWRIPFLVAGPLGLVGLYLRSRLEDTPAFLALEQKDEVSDSPLRDVVVKHWRPILVCMGLVLFYNVAVYTILFYMPTYLQTTTGLAETPALLYILGMMLIIMAVIVPVGALSDRIGANVVSFSSIFVKLSYAGLFIVVILALIWLSQMALNSPWGRMMRAIRDNEVSASAMGKNVTRRHLQIFILGSAVCGLAGAMMTTLDGQLTPASYQPLRYTFLIWVMVIVGGSGNNFGAVLGGFLIWFLWVQVEPIGAAVIDLVTSGMADGSWLKAHLQGSVQHMRLLTMGVILLLVLRFAPRGLLPER